MFNGSQLNFVAGNGSDALDRCNRRGGGDGVIATGHHGGLARLRADLLRGRDDDGLRFGGSAGADVDVALLATARTGDAAAYDARNQNNGEDHPKRNSPAGAIPVVAAVITAIIATPADVADA